MLGICTLSFPPRQEKNKKICKIILYPFRAVHMPRKAHIPLLPSDSLKENACQYSLHPCLDIGLYQAQRQGYPQARPLAHGTRGSMTEDKRRAKEHKNPTVQVAPRPIIHPFTSA
jgi:hypothetical protein